MSDRFHMGTFLWGLILTISGAALAAVGFGWWSLDVFDLRYAGPLFVILVGAVIFVGALAQNAGRPSDPEQRA
ncbi:MAG TPA: hypothetical protein VMS74_00090 [Acidimicrobiia bacterium]|nr:hypothetical protein [Acidimicrobiia bacterium]